MSQTTRPKVIFFDLDSTLFDHRHSLECAMAEARNACTIPDTFSLDVLTGLYNFARHRSHESVLTGDSTEKESKEQRVRDFFRYIDREDASDQEVQAFRAVHREAYRRSRQATPGTIKTLSTLREKGYKIVIVTNASTRSQQDKIDNIGIGHFIDGLVSKDVGWTKPDPRIFRLAMNEFGITADVLRENGKTYMVGDSIMDDIRGALDVGLNPVLYSPQRSCRSTVVGESPVPVINHMTQLLEVMEQDGAL